LLPADEEHYEILDGLRVPAVEFDRAAKRHFRFFVKAASELRTAEIVPAFTALCYLQCLLEQNDSLVIFAPTVGLHGPQLRRSPYRRQGNADFHS
jgi:hypothetical protein